MTCAMRDAITAIRPPAWALKEPAPIIGMTSTWDTNHRVTPQRVP